MDTSALVARVRDLERQLARRDQPHAARRTAARLVELEKTVTQLRAELLETQTTLEERMDADGRQRIQMLEELNSMQDDLANARAALRAEQRRNERAPAVPAK